MKTALAVVMSLYCLPAVAKIPCMEPVALDTALRQQYDELPLLAFTSITGARMLLYTNQKNGTWTMARLVNQHMACVVDVGDDFQPVVGQLPGHAT